MMGKVTIRKVLHRVGEHIARQTNQDSLYSRGLSREGWNGGYEQALMDVLAFLNGVPPNDTRTKNWWSESDSTYP